MSDPFRSPTSSLEPRLSRGKAPGALAGSVLALAIAVAAPALAQQNAGGKLVDGKNREIGQVTVTQMPGGVMIEVDARDLPEGELGFHLHEKGVCEADSGFKSAGGHLAGSKQHGFANEKGPHPGDMPNVFVQQDGILKVEVYNPRVAVAGGQATALLDADGSALMIHRGADDYRSEPAGHSGDRIACAVLRAG